jgi:hypothetical protein
MGAPALSADGDDATVGDWPARSAEAQGSQEFELSPVALDADSDENRWRLELNTWIWPMGIEGDVGAFGLTKSVDASFVDILDATDSIIGLAGRLEVGKGRFAGFIDGSYSKLGVDDVTVNAPDIDVNANIDFNIDLGGGPFNPNPNPDPNPDLSLGLLPAEVDITTELLIIDFGMMYQLGTWRMGHESAGHPRNLTLDAYAGGRFARVSIEIDAENSAGIERDRDWVDPIVGAKVRVPFADNWEILVWGDIGGFGVESDLTWSATAVLGYDFTLFDHSAAVYGGYRAMGWDFSEGSGRDKFTWDVTMHGPILGFSLFF